MLTIMDISQLDSQSIADNGEESTSKEKSLPIQSRSTWSVNQTWALIAAIEACYDEMHHVEKRKQFWSIISEELCSQNIEFSDLQCKKKWLNLMRTYKNTKDLKSKAGRGPVKFVFYDRLDELLGNSLSNKCPHSIDVDELQSQSLQQLLNTEIDDINSERSSCSYKSASKKGVIPTIKKECLQHIIEQRGEEEECLKYKKSQLEQYKEKIERLKVKRLTDSVSSITKQKSKNPTMTLKKRFQKNEKERIRKLYVEESLKYKKEKLQLYKQKVTLEQNKMQAFKDLLEACRNK